MCLCCSAAANASPLPFVPCHLGIALGLCSRVLLLWQQTCMRPLWLRQWYGKTPGSANVYSNSVCAPGDPEANLPEIPQAQQCAGLCRRIWNEVQLGKRRLLLPVSTPLLLSLHAHTHTHTYTHTLSHTHSHSFTLSHTHIHTLSHSHTLKGELTVWRPWPSTHNIVMSIHNPPDAVMQKRERERQKKSK